MNLGLTTSFIIGGILLLTIGMMNMSVSSSSTELTLTQITREKTATVSEMLSSDIQKIGYNRNGKTSPIFTEADGKKIEFRSNIDNSTDGSVETITWEFLHSSSGEVTSTSNPNDYILKRTVRKAATGSLVSETPITLGVTKFRVAYYNKYGVPLSDSLSTPVPGANLDDIKQMYITLRLESGEQVFKTPSSPGRYVPSVWEKRFSPPNLEETN